MNSTHHHRSNLFNPYLLAVLESINAPFRLRRHLSPQPAMAAAQASVSPLEQDAIATVLP
jgi:hypothetical protein